jgi:PIN domain nuclease of toxin-antitoxin system
MRLLLDTHSFLWLVWGNPRLSPLARSLIADPNNVRLLSAASYLEIAVKVSVGKLNLTEPLGVFLLREVPNNSIQILPIEIAHAAVVATLPLHHRDPFDRLLVAQALAEQLPLLSADASLDAYNVQRLW